MVESPLVRQVLIAVADSLPERGDDVLRSLEIREIWGGTVLVRLHVPGPPGGAGRDSLDRLRQAVEDALGGRRHRVELVSTSPPPMP